MFRAKYCVAATLFSLLSSTSFAQKVGEHVVVTADQADIKVKTDVVDTARKGQVFIVREAQGNWLGVMDRAFGYIEKKHVIPFSQAGEYFDRAIRRDSRDALAYAARANVYAAHGHYDKALPDYNQAIRLDSRSAAFYIDRGIAWKQKGNLPNANADFQEAIRLEPENGTAYLHRGTVWEEMGDYDKAVADYLEAIRLSPNDRRPQNNVAWIWSTSASNALRDGNRGVQAAIRACELSAWKDVNYLDTLAAAYAEAGDFESAVAWQKRAIDGAEQSAKLPLQARLELYQTNRPYREPAAAP